MNSSLTACALPRSRLPSAVTATVSFCAGTSARVSAYVGAGGNCQLAQPCSFQLAKHAGDGACSPFRRCQVFRDTAVRASLK